MNTIGKTTSGVYALKDIDRKRHMYVIGQTGTGKTVLFENLIHQDIFQGHGLALLDPHGDLARAVIGHIPSSRVKDLIYLNPSDLERPLGYNVLCGVPEDRKSTVVDNIVAAFVHIWGETSIGARSQQVLRNSLRALVDVEGSTLLCIPRLLTDKGYRAKIVGKIHDPFVKSYWTDQFENYDARKRDDVISPILNKLDAFLSSPVTRNIVSQPESTFDIRRLMDGGGILVVNLSKGAIGEENAHILGALIVTGIAQAALSREDIPEQTRRTFHLYADEFQNFATSAFALILSEARKYALTLTLGHQFLEQIGDLRQAVIGNVGNTIAFRVGADDASLVARQLGWKQPDALQDQANYRAMARFLEGGSPTGVVVLETYPAPAQRNFKPEKAITHSRMRFGRGRRDVEERIRKFLTR
jgi:type IV secretory pathway TraG/TraD family ATPase VirD4